MIDYEFTPSVDFHLEGWRRAQQFNPLNRQLAWMKGLFALITTAGGIAWATTEVHFSAAFWGAPVLLTLLIFKRPLLEWLIRRHLSRLPPSNARVRLHFTEEGMDYSEEKGSGLVRWSAFTQARRFPDGWLLQRGPAQCNWLPDAARVEGRPRRRTPSSAPTSRTRVEAPGRFSLCPPGRRQPFRRRGPNAVACPSSAASRTALSP